MPDKYGQKYWLAVDKNIKNVVNRFPYVGRDESHSRDERVSNQVVMRMLKPQQMEKCGFYRELFHLSKVGHRVAKIQNKLGGNS